MNEHFSSISDKEAKDISVVFMKIYGAKDVNNYMHKAGRLARYEYVLVRTYIPAAGRSGTRDGGMEDAPPSSMLTTR